LRKRVLIIDCDFQCSASIALLGRKTLNDLISRDATLDCELQRGIERANGVPLRTAAVPARHCVKEATGLMFVLPGNPDMPKRERQILASFMPGADIHCAYERASTTIGKLYQSLVNHFDVVLIDCPPGLTLFSEAAIKAADGLIIPTLPSEISFAAVDHLRREIKRTRPDRSLEDLLVGTVVSKLSQRSSSEHHRNQIRTIEDLLDRAAPGFRILKPYLPYCKELEAMTWRDDEAARTGFRERYGRLSELVEQLVDQVIIRCGALVARRLLDNGVPRQAALACEKS
jgi:cellulose biosynthesis protein BcsQ